MWEAVTDTGSEWMRFYSRGISKAFRTMGPDEYMILTVVAFILAIGLMRMNFGR